ncbi:hypothetical protein VTK26DRAFT_7868 [Humicola hyalothermophila]
MPAPTMELHARSINRSICRPGLLAASSPRRPINSFVPRGSRPRLSDNASNSFIRPRELARPLFLLSRKEPPSGSKIPKTVSVTVASVLLAVWLYPTDVLQHAGSGPRLAAHRSAQQPPTDQDAGDCEGQASAWARFAQVFDSISFMPSTDGLQDKVVDMIMPEWTKLIPGYVKKLQRELNLAPGSLAAEIWQESQDPHVHPEIQYSANVRVSEDLCRDEKIFLERRKRMVVPALARYLGLKEEDIHPDDVPTIAMCSSGGGLRSLVAGTGSFMATAEDGLFDCVTYLSGVSGSCWLQSLFYSSVSGANFQRAINHLKARLGTHIAYPPVAFTSLTSSPTNKYLLTGLVEKLKGDPLAQFGLVDFYGVLLGARLLVPKGELGVNEKDFKLSNQREYIKYGQNPLPIYCAVRHEIPELDSPDYGGPGSISEEAKDRARREAWFQWFEMTPYEFFCEEFSAGIPTWAMGRKFKNGQDVPTASGYRLPEVRMPMLLGIWGSAFCATLSHYYREVRPLIKSITGLHALDELIWGYNKDLSMVHPIEPASIPNFVYGMYGQLPGIVPQAVYDNEYIQLMDAGMSNNLPIYPLLRPGRDVDIIVAFDASADIKTDNWLSLAEGYARQRGIKGWPVGIGWPQPTEPPSTVATELDQAQAHTAAETDGKLTQAKTDQALAAQQHDASSGGATTISPTPPPPSKQAQEESLRREAASHTLGYCTVWVGTTQQREADPPPPPPIDDTSTWRLTEPDAGIAVVYLPLLANEAAAPGVDVATADYMSTWNFVYTPRQVDAVVGLAKANYAEGREQVRQTVRAVYERKRRRRLGREREERWRARVESGGDHFS